MIGAVQGWCAAARKQDVGVYPEPLQALYGASLGAFEGAGASVVWDSESDVECRVW